MPDCPAYPADIQEAEARGFARAREWQPIETAPKDGTLVLLAYNTGPDPFDWGMATARYRWSGWHTVNGNPRSFEPTHWQLLPEPPQ